jgi:hypothetical protein
MKTTLKLAAFLALDLMALIAIGNAARAQTTPTTPTFFARRDYPIGSQFQVADVNGDGIPDLIALSCQTITVQFGNGDGTFRPGPTTKVAACGGSAFVASDLNGDGNVDMAVSTGNGVVISMGNGDGTFQPSVNYPINDTVVGYLVVGDFNNDGILDIRGHRQHRCLVPGRERRWQLRCCGTRRYSFRRV